MIRFCQKVKEEIKVKFKNKWIKWPFTFMVIGIKLRNENEIFRKNQKTGL